jgi:uracil-DNA glycosylase
MESLAKLHRTIIGCHKCPRLVRWREQVSKDPPRRYRGEGYWAKPIPGFGDPRAQLLIVGLAPAAHGGNRTGRVFTGDRSGDWLYGALYAFGFANQSNSDHLKDGLKLNNCYVTAAVRCAPPTHKPLRDEFENCRPYLVQELLLRPQFGHEASVRLDDDLTLIASYHPSQQNTFTGKLTRDMFHAIFSRARKILNHR